ncbi:MAG: translation elongation factor Ts [Phycisphaerales bacterium]
MTQTEISAKEVMALRQRTGLSMMECKKALVEAGGDAEAAEDLLRKKMKGKMDTRTDRAAGEGRIAVAIDGSSASIVELRAETDFTAKNETFVNAANDAAKAALSGNAGAVTPSDETAKAIDNLRISTGENISLARGVKMTGENVCYGSYVHHDGKTGVLVQGTAGIADEVLRDICMHITAASPRPEGVTRDDVPAELIEKERKLAMEMAIEGGKNEEIAAKMVEGKINKLYSELALLEQPFVKDDTKKIKDLLTGDQTILAFERWEVGGGA